MNGFNVVPDVLSNGEPCYTANDPALPGCYGFGDTVEEAIERLASARHAYIATLERRGLPIPPPYQGPTAIWRTSRLNKGEA